MSKVLLGLSSAVVTTCLLVACGNSRHLLRTARDVVLTTAEVVEEVDQELAPLLAPEVERCDERTSTRAAFRECLEPLLPLRYGVALGRRSVRAGGSVVDAWAAGHGGWSEFLPVLACSAEALRQLLASIRMFGLPVETAEVLRWLDDYASLVTGFCPEAEFEAAEEELGEGSDDS